VPSVQSVAWLPSGQALAALDSAGNLAMLDPLLRRPVWLSCRRAAGRPVCLSAGRRAERKEAASDGAALAAGASHAALPYSVWSAGAGKAARWVRTLFRVCGLGFGASSSPASAQGVPRHGRGLAGMPSWEPSPWPG
jgi:hypothetical protein